MSGDETYSDERRAWVAAQARGFAESWKRWRDTCATRRSFPVKVEPPRRESAALMAVLAGDLFTTIEAVGDDEAALYALKDSLLPNAINRADTRLRRLVFDRYNHEREQAERG